MASASSHADQTSGAAGNPASYADDCTVFLMRHATADHNGLHHYPHKDPGLTASGIADAQRTILPQDSQDLPDLILVSPLTRALQTAQIIFRSPDYPQRPPNIQVWPDLRESNNTTSSQGQSVAVTLEKFPTFDFSECHEEWDYGKDTHSRAVVRAERVRQRIKELSTRYRNIWVITHSIFLSYLVDVKGRHFWTCESRKFRLAKGDEAVEKRHGWNHVFRRQQDFGPTVLVQKD